MNFINHSGPSSLDSGDALDCINEGITTVTDVLRMLRRRPGPKKIEDAITALDEWKQASQALLDCLDPDAEDEDELEDEYDEDEDGP